MKDEEMSQWAWLHDAAEKEREAVPLYRRALELGLAGKERRGALLGLGSTLRTFGEYEEAQAVFEEAMKAFPEAREFNVFYAMVLYNLRKYEEAMAVLLGQLADTSADEGIRTYSRAIRFYAGRLDRIWD